MSTTKLKRPEENLKTVLTVTKNGLTVAYAAETGESILAVLRREGVFIPAFCGGHELCGKCRVTAYGALSPVTEAEKEKLTPDELAAGWRLACSARIDGEVCVSVPDDGEYSVLTDTGDAAPDYFPSCWESLGAAIDLGTTTVAIYVYSLETRRRVGVVSGVNRQQPLGADVISRIEYCLNEPDGSERARGLIVGQISEMLAGFGKKRGIPVKRLRSVTIAGNTAMLYLLTGKSPKPLSAAPFEADELFGSFRKASDLGLDLPEANVLLLPCVSAFIGGDITAGMIAAGIHQTDNNLLFIDFGTNGEMVLASGGKLTCCSTAAGPAFEGARISCGVGGVPGAINRVTLEGGALKPKTIAGTFPVGLAGSGLIDAVACLRRLGRIDESGFLAEPYELAEGVTLQPQDVRELQLAKSAVRAGAETLLEKAGLTAADLDGVLLTGGFGAGLDKGNALALGLLPDVPAEKVRALGNCAGAGAVRALLDPMALAELETAVAKADTIRLDGDPAFSEKFMENMLFPKI